MAWMADGVWLARPPMAVLLQCPELTAALAPAWAPQLDAGAGRKAAGAGKKEDGMGAVKEQERARARGETRMDGAYETQKNK